MKRRLLTLFALVASTAVGCSHRPAARQTRTKVHDEQLEKEISDLSHLQWRGGQDEPPHAGAVGPAKKSSFSQRYAERRAAYLSDPATSLPSPSPYSDRPELHAVYAEYYQRAFFWASELESPMGIWDYGAVVGKERAAAKGETAGRWNGWKLRKRLTDEIRAEDVAAGRGGHNP